tara:strand:- start:25 stop:141 length:117 start_codon:yes stop_codon:yes gene_type:complete
MIWQPGLPASPLSGPGHLPAYEVFEVPAVENCLGKQKE